MDGALPTSMRREAQETVESDSRKPWCQRDKAVFEPRVTSWTATWVLKNGPRGRVPSPPIIDNPQLNDVLVSVHVLA